MSTRTFVVEAGHAGRPLASWLADRLRLTQPAVVRLVRDQRVRVAGVPCPDPDRRLHAGQRVEVRLPEAERKPAHPDGPRPRIVHVGIADFDEHGRIPAVHRDELGCVRR